MNVIISWLVFSAEKFWKSSYIRILFCLFEHFYNVSVSWMNYFSTQAQGEAVIDSLIQFGCGHRSQVN